MVLQVLQVCILFIYSAFITLTLTCSRSQATTPRRNNNQGTTPHRNRNQVNTPRRRHRKKTIPGLYEITCSTTTLRRHLANNHWEAWIMSCMESGIEITSSSKEVCKALDKFERKHGGEDSARAMDGSFPVYRAYTPKTFLDAIINWIIVDDQVCLFYFIIVYYSFVYL
jgi:hypothetical protein